MSCFELSEGCGGVAEMLRTVNFKHYSPLLAAWHHLAMMHDGEAHAPVDLATTDIESLKPVTGMYVFRQ